MREIQFIAYNSKDLYDTIMRYSVASKYDKLATSCIVLICHFSKKCYCYLMAIFRANSFGFFVTATAGTPTTTTRAPRMPPGSGGSSGRHRVHRNRAFLGPFVEWLV